jgi:hypothetical protein
MIGDVVKKYQSTFGIVFKAETAKYQLQTSPSLSMHPFIVPQTIDRCVELRSLRVLVTVH